MSNRMKLVVALGVALALAPLSSVAADTVSGSQAIREAQGYFQKGQYFRAARYAFAATESDSSLQAEAYSWVTVSLARAGLYNASSYFYIKTLQSGNKTAIRRVLTQTQELLVRLGGDLLRKYLVQNSDLADYDSTNRGAFLYALGKDALLKGQESRAVEYLSGVPSGTPLRPYALELRAAARAIQGQNDGAIQDFKECADRAKTLVDHARNDWEIRARKAEAQDLRARCIAGEARTLYQLGRNADADWTYDQIPKSSLVWTDILFEQAWNSFAKQEYNRSLGKLVSYKSPALSFVFNSEVDVLRAQTYLAMCLYSDANEAINEFNSRYQRVGEEVKRFVEQNSSNLNAFYEFGKEVLRSPLYTSNPMHQLANRFIRGPYFQQTVLAERAVQNEISGIRQFASMQSGVDNRAGRGFPGFLEQVLRWRVRTIQSLGGAFVKNSLLDYHSTLISDFEKMAFIKLEMLGRAKEKLLYKKPLAAERSRGAVEPSRRNDQYYWTFNGEFWNDELGDYVFGLESECGKS